MVIVLFILQETLRTALAMGCDRGIHVLLDDKEYEGLQPLAVAKLFQKITEQENPNLIILGKQVPTSEKLNDFMQSIFFHEI